MLNTSSNGLLLLAIALAGGTASAQFPAGYGQPTAPAYGQPAPMYGQPAYGQPTPGYAQPTYEAPQGGQYGPGPYENAPVYGNEQVYQGEMPADGVPQGAEGGPIPYSEDFGSGPQGLGYPGVISNGGGDQLYPYDQQDPWLHGYWQEIPAYGGYAHFRPYNYKHVLAQTQAAAGWGLDPRMPYSQQFWHRYERRASLEHCPLPAHALDNPNAELDPSVEAERIRRELRDGERRLKTLEKKGF